MATQPVAIALMVFREGITIASFLQAMVMGGGDMELRSYFKINEVCMQPRAGR